MLPEAIEGVLNCRVPENHNVSIVVIDNASTDNTKDIVLRYAANYPVRYIFESQPGKSFALNRSLIECDSDYLLYTDDDAIVDREWAAEILSFFDKHNADIVYGKVIPRWIGECPNWYDRDFDGFFALLDHGNEELLNCDGPLVGYGVNNAFKVTSLNKIGGFRVDLGPRHNRGAGGEDTAIFLNAHQKGLRIGYCPRAFVQHIIPQERCKKRYYRKRTWRGSEDLAKLLQEEQGIPKFMNIARYRYRIFISDIYRYLYYTLCRNPSKQFLAELRATNFIGAFYFLNVRKH